LRIPVKNFQIIVDIKANTLTTRREQLTNEEEVIMIIRSVLVALSCLTFNFLSAQTKEKFVIAETVDKGDYYYISKSALVDSVKGILYQRKLDRKADASKRPMQFYWISTCNDGYYNLTITPEQIFFSSSHENPNPDYLFWVIDIDSIQFRQIRTALQKKSPAGFDNLSKYYHGSLTVFYDKKFKDSFSIPEDWIDSITQQHDRYCESQIETQLVRYFSIINSFLPGAKKIMCPQNKMKSKYFGYSREEIMEWAPARFHSTSK
jgi:hypothetical protein